MNIFPFIYLELCGVDAEFGIIRGLHSKFSILSKHLVNRPAIGVAAASTTNYTSHTTILNAPLSIISLLRDPSLSCFLGACNQDTSDDHLNEQQALVRPLVFFLFHVFTLGDIL